MKACVCERAMEEEILVWRRLHDSEDFLGYSLAESAAFYLILETYRHADSIKWIAAAYGKQDKSAFDTLIFAFSQLLFPTNFLCQAKII